MDVVALFTKFGPITTVHRIKSRTKENTALICFETAAGAAAALAAKPKALTLGDKVLNVSLLRDGSDTNNRTVVVGLFGSMISKDDLKTFFEKVGAVESVVITANRSNPRAFVRFKSIDDIPKALELHNSELFSRFITVRPYSYWEKAAKSPELTLVLENVAKHESYNSDTIEKIFKKFGDLDSVDVVCTNTVLAFVVYKQPESATKAISELNGTTVDNLVLKVSRYTRFNNTIKITNLALGECWQLSMSYYLFNIISIHVGATESDLREVFGKSGEIESVQIIHNKAFVKFATEDAYCKSFLLNEYLIKKQPIFIEPNSQLKHAAFKYKGFQAGAASAKFPNTKKFGHKNINKRPQQNSNARPFAKKAKKF